MALWNPLRKFFGEPPAPPAPPAARPGVPAPARAVSAAAPAPAAAALAPTDGPALDRAFSAQLLVTGPLLDGPPAPAEQAVLDLLAGMAAQGLDPALVPRLPAVLPKLMSLVRRDDVSPRELADLLGRDPSLVGEVVRLANSARYRPVREITDLQGAVLVLGQIGLAQLVTRVAVRPIFNAAQGRFGRAAAAPMWDLAERCAHACAALRAGQADVFAAYLAGTAAHVGLMASVRVLDQSYGAQEPPASTGFHDALWRHAAQLSVHAARDWAFPENVVAALAQRAGTAPRDPGDALATALLAADRAAKRQLLAPEVAATLPAPPAGPEATALAELARSFGSEATA